MAFFLKKSTLKGRTYLSIVESYYSPQKHGGAHRTYKSLASVETWKAKGIDDPIAYFQKEVDELNKNNKNKNSLKISDHSPELYLGYFPFISMMNKMDIKKYVDYFNLHNSFEFDLYELLSSLIYARLVNPCSKHRTFHEVLPQLRDGVHFSYDQLLMVLNSSAMTTASLLKSLMNRQRNSMISILPRPTLTAVIFILK